MNDAPFLSPFFSPYDRKLKQKGILVFLGVILAHLGLLGLFFYRSPPPAPKKPAKVLVQTVRLAPLQPVLPPASPVLSPSLPSQKEEEPLPVLEKKPDKPIPASAPPPTESAVTQPPLPAVKKAEPIPKKEEKKTIPALKTPSSPVKAPAPVKKAVEPKKEEKKEPPKPKKNLEADTKKEQEKKEKEKKEKLEKEKQEKKRRQEKQEQEKRQQQEKLEKEKKEKELAAAQEVARQKERALEEKLAKIRETSDKINLSSSSVNLESTSLPKELNLQIDALFIDTLGNTTEWGAKEVSYRDEVAYRLKRSLKLPEYGAVKIKLTLERSGKVLRVETMDSESKKNKDYIEKEIPKIVFSPFGQRFQDASDNTFLITLYNDS